MLVFISKLLSSGDEISSKRFFGAVMLIYAMLLIWLERQHDSINDLLYIGAGLLGLGLVDKIRWGNKQEQPYYYQNQEQNGAG